MKEPRVTVSDRLAAYLKKKGCRYILMSIATCKSCGGAVGELYARPAKDREAERLLAEGQPGLRQLPCLDASGEALAVEGSPVELLVSGCRHARPVRQNGPAMYDFLREKRTQRGHFGIRSVHSGTVLASIPTRLRKRPLTSRTPQPRA